MEILRDTELKIDIQLHKNKEENSGEIEQQWHRYFLCQILSEFWWEHVPEGNKTTITESNKWQHLDASVLHWPQWGKEPI